MAFKLCLITFSKGLLVNVALAVHLTPSCQTRLRAAEVGTHNGHS